MAKLVNATVCKTVMRRFEPGRGLQQRILTQVRVFCWAPGEDRRIKDGSIIKCSE